nr:hypothetical protein [Tanacetum cinerariifolium]
MGALRDEVGADMVPAHGRASSVSRNPTILGTTRGGFVDEFCAKAVVCLLKLRDSINQNMSKHLVFKQGTSSSKKHIRAVVVGNAGRRVKAKAKLEANRERYLEQTGSFQFWALAARSFQVAFLLSSFEQMYKPFHIMT